PRSRRPLPTRSPLSPYTTLFRSRLDVLVNNAGITVAAHTLELDLDTWQKVIDLNMTAVFLCAREAARHMLVAGGGAIINTASVQDRKSTRLNSSHGSISYAVFCL